MQDPKNQPIPRLIIDGGGKSYQVTLSECTEFLNNIRRLGINGIDDLEAELTIINDNVIEAIDEDSCGHQPKLSLRLMRELIFLFKGMLYEIKS